MKKITIFLFTVLLFVCPFSLSFGQTYDLQVLNMTLNSPTDNELEFDIYILRTGGTPLDYAAGRYNFYFNPLIDNGGTLTYSFVSGMSDLPVGLQPTGPSIVSDRLNMTINAFPGSGNGYLISNIYPGTRVCRMKLSTSAVSFAYQPLALSWNNPGSLNPPRTVVYAYNSDGDEINITTPATHSIDSSGIGGLLPVELSSFLSSINRRNVTLNWITASETNNAGFDIERSNVNGQTSNEWLKVGTVSGNGTTASSHSYTFTDRNLASGTYSYRLKQTDFNGNFEYFNLNNEVNVGVPSDFELSQNYPNPFNPATNLEFGISELGFVSLKVYDASGKEVATLVNETKPAGYYSVNFNASSLSSGIYFYTLQANNFTATKKMSLIK